MSSQKANILPYWQLQLTFLHKLQVRVPKTKSATSWWHLETLLLLMFIMNKVSVFYFFFCRCSLLLYIYGKWRWAFLHSYQFTRILHIYFFISKLLNIFVYCVWCTALFFPSHRACNFFILETSCFDCTILI